MCVIATIVPNRLKISFSGWSASCRSCSRSLIGPLSCSSTNQAVVRTSSDVQNGTSTKIIRRLETCGGMVASR